MARRGDSIFHRKDGLWEARYVKEIDAFGKKKYGSVYAHTHKEAKEKREAMIENIILYQRPLVSMRNITVSRLVEEWLKLSQTRIKPSTYQRYVGFYKKHIQQTIGGQPAFYLTTISIHDFAAGRLETGISPQTVNGILIFLHSCLKYGHKQYNLPLPDIIYLSYNKKEMRVLSKDEQQKLVSYLLKDTDIYKFGILLALFTGLRIGELCGLFWEDISEDNITVRRTMQRLQRFDGSGTELHINTPKTASSLRCIPFPSFLKELLAFFRNRNLDQQYFLGEKDMPIIEPRIMQYKFKQYLIAAGIDIVNFHCLRHTFATRCVELGFDLKSLSEIMGHTKIQTTLDLYTHISPEVKQRNMELLRVIW